jgi:putative peptidoglycan binding protein
MEKVREIRDEIERRVPSWSTTAPTRSAPQQRRRVSGNAAFASGELGALGLRAPPRPGAPVYVQACAQGGGRGERRGEPEETVDGGEPGWRSDVETFARLALLRGPSIRSRSATYPGTRGAMSDGEDLVGRGFRVEGRAGLARGQRSREPVPSGPPHPLKSDRDRFRKLATAFPGRLALVTLAVAVSVIVVAVVLSADGNKQTGSPAQTSPGTTPPKTQPQPAAAPTARPAIVVSPATMLRAGDHGPAVRTLQRALRRLGFAVGSPDGVFGPKTEAAVIAFQRAHGLSADGLVGAKTARALNRALARAG